VCEELDYNVFFYLVLAGRPAASNQIVSAYVQVTEDVKIIDLVSEIKEVV
jgi:hypothetical protein